jgi:hypothetical protein
MFRRPELICLVSPLDNTNTSTIEVVLETKIQYLLRVIKSIEIKMIKRRSTSLRNSWQYFRARLAWILLEQGESWTINGLDNTQTLSEPLCKGRFSRSQ